MDTQPVGPPVRVGVLSFHNSKETKAILNAVDALGHDPVWLRECNVRSWIDDGGVHLSPDVDVLANRLLLTKRADPHEALQFAALYDGACPVLNDPAAVRRAIDKYRAAAVLRRAGVPVPNAHLAAAEDAYERWPEVISGEGVQKPTVGTNGHRMRRVDPDTPVNATVGGAQTFVQEHVSGGDGRAFDVRVYVIGGEVRGAMRREAQEGEWRANVALGADVTDVTDSLDAEATETARRAVDALGLDYAGVDLVDDGTWRVLEVNATAGFKGLYEATGRSMAPHIARQAIERVGGSVDEDRVADLAATLDDSVPDCKPASASDAEAKSVLGYTNQVQVSGHDGTEQVVAKADTGAKRTSLDAELAGRLHIGPVTGTTRVRSGTAVSSETRPLVDLSLKVGGEWQTVTASITDRSEMRYPVILGRDVLESYQLDIERRFDEE